MVLDYFYDDFRDSEHRYKMVTDEDYRNQYFQEFSGELESEQQQPTYLTWSNVFLISSTALIASVYLTEILNSNFPLLMNEKKNSK